MALIAEGRDHSEGIYPILAWLQGRGIDWEIRESILLAFRLNSEVVGNVSTRRVNWEGIVKYVSLANVRVHCEMLQLFDYTCSNVSLKLV